MIVSSPKDPNLDALALGLGVGMWILERPRFQAITKFWYTDRDSASLLSVNGSQKCCLWNSTASTWELGGALVFWEWDGLCKSDNDLEKIEVSEFSWNLALYLPFLFKAKMNKTPPKQTNKHTGKEVFILVHCFQSPLGNSFCSVHCHLLPVQPRHGRVPPWNQGDPLDHRKKNIGAAINAPPPSSCYSFCSRRRCVWNLKHVWKHINIEYMHVAHMGMRRLTNIDA